jgi:hypothetical protein
MLSSLLARIGKGHLILYLSNFGCGLWTCGRISNSQTERHSFTYYVELLQSNVGFWDGGWI